MRHALVVVLVLLPACGGGASGDDVPDAAGTIDAAGSDGPPAVTCEDRDPQPLDDVWTLSVGGVDRTIRVHVPASYDPTRATPVVLGFHGYTLSGAAQASASHMIAKADLEGFIAVHADGTGGLRGWNAGDCCGTAASSGIDDVGFVGALLDELEARLCVDADRIYSTGFSNGGFLSHRLACEMADRIAAIAPVSGVMGVDVCNPARPVPVFEVHGTSDSIVPYNGGGISGFRSVAETVADWADRNGCPAGAPVETFAMGDATCEAHRGCGEGSEVSLCTIDGGGHQWPGGDPFPGGGHTSTDLIATDAIWTFFVAHPMVR
jgi:polyhydroxybutyrate depolymerase